MILVLFLCIAILIITLILTLIFISTLRIKLENMNISNIKKNKSAYSINISFYLLNKIKWLAFNISENKIKKITKKIQFKNIDMIKLEKYLQPSDIKELAKINPKISYLKLEFNLGLDDVVVTSYIVAIISTMLSIILPYVTKEKERKNLYYKILPIYNNKNQYHINLDVIFEVKLINVFKVVYKFYKTGTYYQYKSLKETWIEQSQGKECDKNERTSNRRINAYSNE